MNGVRRKLLGGAARVVGWALPLATAWLVVDVLPPAALGLCVAVVLAWWLDERFLGGRTARRLCRLAENAIAATPVWVFTAAPRWALALAVGVGCQLALAHALGVSANPIENMREAAAIMAARKGGAP